MYANSDLSVWQTKCDRLTPFHLVIGDPIPQQQLQARSKDASALMDYLRKATYDLSPVPFDDYDYGYEFEDRHKKQT